ncbi:MAG: hypothetical protein EAZ24_13960 [Burkholderiales bacterium]|nr:MAG: hypothetical protein EAZ24_13960 [Burkholderiales bacterium]
MAARDPAPPGESIAGRYTPARQRITSPPFDSLVLSTRFGGFFHCDGWINSRAASRSSRRARRTDYAKPAS